METLEVCLSNIPRWQVWLSILEQPCLSLADLKTCMDGDSTTHLGNPFQLLNHIQSIIVHNNVTKDSEEHILKIKNVRDFQVSLKIECPPYLGMDE